MLSLSPRYDLFRFLLPKDFLPKEVEDKWKHFINKEPGVVTTPIDYLNESIKSVTIPGISDLNITQPQHSTNPVKRSSGSDGHVLGRLNVEPSQNNSYRSSGNPLDKIERKLTVTFRLNQGLYNYFMLYETIFYRYCKHIEYDEGDTLYIDILNEEGIAVARIKMLQCLVDGIDGLEFSFDKVEREADTFTVTWSFNNIDMDINIPQPV